MAGLEYIGKHPRYPVGTSACLTLDEIRDLIWSRLGCRGIIEIREETSASVAIYQAGNYDDDFWSLHGTTEGWAFLTLFASARRETCR